MAQVQANRIAIEYEEFGNRQAPAMLLVMGLGAQLTFWPDRFCADLAESGFRVIRYDNRDVGLSTKFEAAGVPDIAGMFAKAMAGEPLNPPYLLSDMAADAVGLLDALAIDRAHVVGASMGGMISQIVAAKYPERAASLVSIMSTSGNPTVPHGKPEALQALMSRPENPDDRESLIRHSMRVSRIIGSPGFPPDEAEHYRQVARNIDRAYYPQGMARQFAAILASGSRIDLLKTIRVPSLVVHGADDPLVPVEGGKDTAAHIPGAALKIIPGMGHGLEPGLVPLLVEAIADYCRQREAA